MKKKIVLALVFAAISVLLLGAVGLSAETYGDLTYIIEDDGIVIMNCSKTVTEIDIPKEIDGRPVISIFWFAFQNCTDLVSVTIPDTVLYIDDGAFENCSSLNSVTIPDSVTSIGDDAFSYCSSLTSITIPDSVTSIGKYAFNECSSLTSVTIPDSVTMIGSGVFKNCSSLSKVYITDISAWCNISFADKYSNPLVYAGNLYLNDKLVEILAIPDSVTSIGEYAFSECSSLISVTIPDSVTEIGDQAFYDCSSLISVTIPDSVTTIGYEAFYGCSSLISVTIPDSVTTIGNSAFSKCSSLTRVNITDIAAWCKIDFDNSYSNPLYYANNLYLNDKLVENVVVPDGITSLDNDVFYGCSSLVSITIPDSVTSIGDYAFSGCSSLTSITIPDSITTIGNSAFFFCSSLISITIPDSVTTIGNSAFFFCSSLISITIPDSVTYIGDHAFSYCSSLISVTIPDSVTKIEESIFLSCTNLKTVVLPADTFYIKTSAFKYCSNLTTVFFKGTEAQWSNIIMYSGNDYLTSAEIIYNATERTFKFKTNCAATLPDMIAYCIASAPTVENGTITLLGWYDNASLSGDPVTFPYYGESDTLYAAWTDRTGKSFDDAFIAEANKQYPIESASSGETVYFEFTPKITGEYRFYTTGSLNIRGYLYDSEQWQLTYNTYGGEGNNFYITYTLTAGEKYYIAANVRSGTGSFTFVTETDCIEGTKTVCVTSVTGEKIIVCLPSYLPEGSRIFLACYKNGRMTETQNTANANETVYFVTRKDFDSAKIMVWDAFGTFRPLCEAELVN